MGRCPHPPETQLQWQGLASIPCSNYGENEHQENWKLFFCFPSSGFWCLLPGFGRWWALQRWQPGCWLGRVKRAKITGWSAWRTISIKYDLPLHLLANSLCGSSSPAKEQLLICMHHHSGHDYCWHDMSCIKGSFRRDCVSWIKTVSFYPKENAMHQVY